MSDEEFKRLRRVYRSKEGVFPPYGEAATIEQASAFRTVVQKLNQISVDFAILVPNGDRALARRHFTSRQRDTHGNWTYVEVYGPPTYGEWVECYMVFNTLAIQDDVICGGNLRQYNAKIAEYVNRCPDAWGVVYQADVRTRSEHAPLCA